MYLNQKWLGFNAVYNQQNSAKKNKKQKNKNMACKILYNTQGERVGVTEVNSNKPSQTFQDILNDAHVKNFDEALQIYKNLYSEDIEFITERVANENSVQVAIQRNNGNPLNLAPNGKPSILYQSYKDLGYSEQEVERLTAQVYSDSFLNFFGDWLNNPQNASKVVDENGQPLVVRHQSQSAEKFTSFIEKATKNKWSVSKKGLYFSSISSERLNEQYNRTKIGNQYQVFLNIRNILDLKDKTVFDFNNNESLNYGDLLNRNDYNSDKVDENENYFRIEEIDSKSLTKLKKLNYDGVWGNRKSEEWQATDEIVAFNPNQIKSATENIGTFSTDSNDIRFSLESADPTLKYQTEEGNIYTSYAEALRNTNGKEIKAGVNTTNGFKEFYTTSTNTSIDSQEGLINHLIKTGTLSGKSYKENGKTHLIPEGKNFVTKRLNAEAVKDIFKKQLGIKSAKLKADSSIELSEDLQRNKVTVTTANGEQIIVSMEELNAPFSELKKKFDKYTVATALATNAVEKEMSKKSDFTPSEIIPENELQRKLINLLNKFGIKTLSFSKYTEGYLKRNELPINARALADLANKIVAFKDGIIENDDLVEETSHLIVASMAEEQKVNLKRNIHKTKEWGEYAKQYEGIYATEDELREEILGKVVANVIKENFTKRNQNQTEDSIIAKIQQLFEEFLQNIRNYFQDSFKKELDTITNTIYNQLFDETLELDLEGKSGIFFSASTIKMSSIEAKKLVKITQDALELVQTQQNQLNKKYKDSSDSTYIEQSKKLLEIEELSYKLDGVAKFARLVSGQTNRLLTSTAKKQEGEFPLTSEENLMYQNLKNNVRGAISEIYQLLNDKDSVVEKRIKEDLDKTRQNLDALEAKVRDNTEPAINRLVEDLIIRHDMSEKEAEEYRALIESAVRGTLKDTDVVHTYIGSLLNAQNPLLNMGGLISRRLYHQTNQDFQGSWKNFVNKLTPLNWKNSDFEKIIDKKTNKIINERDPQKEAMWEEKKKRQIFKTFQELETEYSDINNYETLEDYLEKSTDKETDKEEVQNSFYKQWGKISSERFVPYYKKEFTEARDSFELTINDNQIIIAESALLRDKEYSRQIGEIRKNAVNDQLTEEDKEKIKEISVRRLEDANPRDASTGEYIAGVTEEYDENKRRYFVVKSANFNKLTEEQKERAEIIIGLNQLSYKTQYFLQQNEALKWFNSLNTKPFKKEDYGKESEYNEAVVDYYKKEANIELPQKFLDALSELTTTEEKLKFLRNNAYIGYSDAYYQEMSERDTLVDRLRDLGTADELVDSIRAQKAIIQNILKANAIKNEPGEIDIYQVTDVQKNSISLAQSILESYYKEARLVLEDVEVESFSAITRPTDSYLAFVEDMTLEEELAFIKKNTTPNGEAKLLDAKRIANGERSIPKSFKNIFTEGADNNQALLEYARTLLLPHLKKTEPLDYAENFAKVKNGELSVEDWIQGDSVKVSPSFGFYESDKSNINPEWQDNKDNNREQYTKEYLKEVRDDRFDAIKNDKRLYEGWKATMEYYDYQIENNNLTGVQSRYLAPNVRRTNTQRALSLTPQGVAETFKEMMQFRPEEQELGGLLSNGLYTIPTYYNKPLDNPAEQTTDYLWAFAVYGQAATLHKYRRENIGDMFVLEDSLSRVKDNHKNANKMFKSFMEYNFYGKQENFSYKIGNVDLGKILRTVNNFAKKYNIAGITVGLTSAYQATVAKNMERVIGEVIDPTSSNIGNSLWVKLAPASAKEVMKFDSKSVINVLGESFGLYSPVHRYENSQLGVGGRAFVNLSSKLHEIGNFPVIQRAMLGVIASYRYVDGRIIHYNKFKKKLETENFKGSIKEEWKKQPEFIHDLLTAVENGVLNLNNPKFLELVAPKLTNIPQGKTLEDYLQDRKLDIGLMMQSFIQRIDSQVPNDERAIVQRDGRMNFFTSHLGWLISSLSRKTKNRHYNVSEESWQEGSWRTAGEFVRQLIKNPKNFKEIYGELDFAQKKNLKRTLVELGYANAIALLGLVLSQMSDDDDTVLPFFEYFTNRVAVETISGTVGLPTSVYSLLDNPIMLATKMKQWAKVTDLVGTDEERWKYLKSYSGYLRDYDKMLDLKKATKSYLFFQNEKKNLYDIYAPLTLLYSDKEE